MGCTRAGKHTEEEKERRKKSPFHPETHAADTCLQNACEGNNDHLDFNSNSPFHFYSFFLFVLALLLRFLVDSAGCHIALDEEVEEWDYTRMFNLDGIHVFNLLLASQIVFNDKF